MFVKLQHKMSSKNSGEENVAESGDEKEESENQQIGIESQSAIDEESWNLKYL